MRANNTPPVELVVDDLEEVKMKALYSSKKKIFCIIMILNYSIYWSEIFFSRGKRLVYYFVHDTHNTFMDFIGPLLKNADSTYTAPTRSNYPVLANLFSLFIKHFIPINISKNQYLMQASMYTLIIIIIFLLSFVLVFNYLTLHLLLNQQKNLEEDYCASILILLSGPFLFTYERGNMILLALILSLLFTYLYQSKRKLLMHISYIALAVAAAIKIYPALFGLIIIQRKSIKKILLAIFYGFIIFFIPFWIFYDGWSTIHQFINNIFYRNGNIISWGLGYKFSFQNMIKIMYELLLHKYCAHVNQTFMLIPLLICLMMFLLSKELWKKTFSICLFITWIPSDSFTYVLCFFSIPLILFLSEETKITGLNYFYLVSFCIIFSLYSWNRIDWININTDSYQLTWGMVFVNIWLFFFAIVIFLEVLIDFVKSKKTCWY